MGQLTRTDPRARSRSALVFAGVALLGFALVAASVQARWLYSWDATVFGWLYSGESPWPHGPTTGRENSVLQMVLPWCDALADARVLLSLVLVTTLIFSRRSGRAALFLGGSVAVVLLAGELKQVFGRPSPFPLPGDPSFPSGHATLSMALAAAAVTTVAGTRALWSVLALAVTLVLAVAVAAIADGGHWPTDIVGGWALALAWVAALRLTMPGPLLARSTIS